MLKKHADTPIKSTSFSWIGLFGEAVFLVLLFGGEGGLRGGREVRFLLEKVEDGIAVFELMIMCV